MAKYDKPFNLFTKLFTDFHHEKFGGSNTSESRKVASKSGATEPGVIVGHRLPILFSAGSTVPEAPYTTLLLLQPHITRMSLLAHGRP